MFVGRSFTEKAIKVWEEREEEGRQREGVQAKNRCRGLPLTPPRPLPRSQVVMLAQEEARRLGHNFVGTEQVSDGRGIGLRGVGWSECKSTAPRVMRGARFRGVRLHGI